MSERLLHDLDRAADVLSVSRRVLERLIADGEIESVKIGRRRLVAHEDLEDYVARLKAVS